MKKDASGEETEKKALLVGIRDPKMSVSEADSLVNELLRLIDTLELKAIAIEKVHVREKNAKYGVGTGKAEELAQKAADLQVDCIVFDREISPSQQRNWETLTGIPAIDRQELIIQIFASRARTREAVLQINLAELEYSLPRLQHKYVDLSRQRGGRYGTRGSGETRLETDRRKVESRIHKLEDELEELKRQRQVQRKKREKEGVPVCALVGYTNAGKSSILNSLTGAGVLAEDKLFATLDSTSRRLRLPGGMQIILIDTVGFIRRLPHSLVKAFHSTLEEVNRADLILNVLDATDQDIAAQCETTLSVLKELEAENIPRITVLNKIDKLKTPDISGSPGESCQKISFSNLFPDSTMISAMNGTGLPDLCIRIEDALSTGKSQK